MDNIVLYGGEVELVFDRRMHGYKRNGVKVPSVTKILSVINKPFLIPWAVNETLEYIARHWRHSRHYTLEEIQEVLTAAKGSRNVKTKTAMDVGKTVHEWIESYAEARANGHDAEARLPDHPVVRDSVKAFLRWEQEHEVEYLMTERRIYSKEYNYSGTVDLVACINGRMTVVDFKTSKAIYQDYYLQAAAYAAALVEEGVIDVPLNDVDLMIVQIPKTGEPPTVGLKVGETESLFNVFRSALTLYNYGVENE